MTNSVDHDEKAHCDLYYLDFDLFGLVFTAKVTPLTLKVQSKICSRRHSKKFFFFFRENKSWHFMWIVCQADDSHEMSRFVFPEKNNKKKQQKTLSSAAVVIGASRFKVMLSIICILIWFDLEILTQLTLLWSCWVSQLNYSHFSRQAWSANHLVSRTCLGTHEKCLSWRDE